MKRISFLLILLFAHLSSTATNLISQVDSIESKTDLILSIPITLNAPVTISNPGLYYLARDLDVASGDGITIATNNVHLDLGKRTIKGSGANNGIVLNAGTSNITVENGKICSMAQNGILVQGNNSVIRDCDFISNSTGITISSGNNNVVESCNAISNTKAGFALSSSVCTVINDAKAINTISTSESAYGFISTSGTSNVFENCLADCIATTTGAGNYIAAGFKLGSSETSSQIVNCKAYSITTPTTGSTVPYGIRVKEIFSGTFSEIIQASHGAQLNEANWSPDGTMLAVAGVDSGGEVQIFSFFSNFLQSIATFSHGGTLQDIKWSPDGRFVAIAGAAPTLGTIEIRVLYFDGSSLTEIATAAQPTATVAAITWSADGKFLAAGGNDNTLRIYSFNGSILSQLTTAGHGAAINSVAWSRDNQYVAIAGAAGTGSNDTRVYSFDGVSTLSLIASAAHGATLNAIDWHPTGKYVSVGGAAASGNQVRVFSFNGSALSSVATAAPGATVESVEWAKDGNYLAVSGAVSGGVEIHIYYWSSNTLTQTDTKAHGGTVYAITWSPNDNYLAAVGAEASSIDIHIYQATITGAQKCLVESNSISGVNGGSTMGVGLSASSLRNRILSNTAANNDINYLLVNNIYTSGAFGIPTLIQNLGLPSL